ncbi:hypothetical protein SRABI128_03070 [Microbacterium sp. Bi128]|nr:hypothetical protein SRABI128_03070 [Microbacterium sp. Bi128]
MTGAPLSSVVGFAVIPEPARMLPPVEALVTQQADPPERAVSRNERTRAHGRLHY